MDARGFHHFYVGMILLLSGFLLVVFTELFVWIGIALVIIGNLICIDDLLQHFIQKFNPEYRSPLNRFYGKTLWKIPAVRRVNEWVDRLLGRKA